eukprot:3486649-Lingulodinium_polyedra.AAC.1
MAHAPCARQNIGVSVECASVQCASRCSCKPSIRPHHCAAFVIRCAMMRSSRPFAAAAVREVHARALHTRASN